MTRVERATPTTRHIAEQIRAARKRQGLTQAELADHVREAVPAFTRTAVVRIELGQREHLRVDELMAIADTLNVSPGDLLPKRSEVPVENRLLEMAQFLTELAMGVQ